MSNVQAWDGRVEKLKHAVMEMPQVELPTEHFFAQGMYCRVLPRAAGTLIVGKVHKKEHFYIVAKGRVRVFQDGKVTEYEAGAVVVSAPGTQRAVLALEDSICMTVHATKRKNLFKIEKELIEPDSESRYDALNNLVKEQLT